LQLDLGKVGYPKPGAAAQSFASCLRIVDPFTFETVFLQEFENRETVFSVYFSAVVGQAYLFLGVGHEATLQRSCRSAEIQTYALSQDG
jgi:splicing factor 3B subunit 3